MKKISTLLTSLFAITLLLAQTSEDNGASAENDNLHLSAGIKTNHLWRGLIITDKPIVSGQLWYDLNKSKTLQLGIWGASAISNDSDDTHYKEINYYIQYADKGFSIGIWDLFNSRNINELIASDDIFNYSKDKTTHIIDLRTSYQFPEKFPLRVEADVMLYGGATAGEVKLNEKSEYDSNKYSTYIEISYPLISKGSVKLNGFLGGGFAFNPGKRSLGQGTFLYGNGKNDFDIVNIGFSASKNIKVFSAHIPLSFTTMWNPSNKYARIQFATTLF